MYIYIYSVYTFIVYCTLVCVHKCNIINLYTFRPLQSIVYGWVMIGVYTIQVIYNDAYIAFFIDFPVVQSSFFHGRNTSAKIEVNMLTWSSWVLFMIESLVTISLYNSTVLNHWNYDSKVNLTLGKFPCIKSDTS